MERYGRDYDGAGGSAGTGECRIGPTVPNGGCLTGVHKMKGAIKVFSVFQTHPPSLTQALCNDVYISFSIVIMITHLNVEKLIKCRCDEEGFAARIAEKTMLVVYTILPVPVVMFFKSGAMFSIYFNLNNVHYVDCTFMIFVVTGLVSRSVTS